MPHPNFAESFLALLLVWTIIAVSSSTTATSSNASISSDYTISDSSFAENCLPYSGSDCETSGSDACGLSFKAAGPADSPVSISAAAMTPRSSTSSTPAPSNDDHPTSPSPLQPRSAVASGTGKQPWIGMAVVNQSPSRKDPSGNRAWKDTSDWKIAFTSTADMLNRDVSHASTKPKFNSVRLYSTTDTNYTGAPVYHLMNAMPAAQTLNMSIHAGVWSGGDPHQARFNQELGALIDVLAEYGCDNLAAVSVGNEDIYNNRSDTGNVRVPLQDIWLLVDQVQQVAATLDRYGCCHVPVTHTDTFGEWLRANVTETLIRQVDFLTVNIFPYWESLSVTQAQKAFWDQLRQVQELAAKYDRTVWVGETGWPVAGASRKDAVAGVAQAEQYWKGVGCELFNGSGNVNAFYYVEWDGSEKAPSFGVLGDGGGTVFSGGLQCP